MKTETALRMAMLALITTCGASPETSVASPTMQAGAWETSMTVTANHPKTGEKVKVSESKNVICLTEKFLQTDPYLSASANEAKMRQRGLDCTMSGYTRATNSADWKMSCVTTDGKSIESTFSVRVSEQQTKTEVDQAVRQGQQMVQTQSLIESSYVGDCTSSMRRI